MRADQDNHHDQVAPDGICHPCVRFTTPHRGENRLWRAQFGAAPSHKVFKFPGSAGGSASIHSVRRKTRVLLYVRGKPRSQGVSL